MTRTMPRRSTLADAAVVLAAALAVMVIAVPRGALCASFSPDYKQVIRSKSFKTTGPWPLLSDAPPAGAQPPTASKLFSVLGLSALDSRLANNGNQLTAEPAIPAVCAGNGFVLQVVQTALRVFKSSDGAPVTATVDLNTFLGYPAAANRSIGLRGPAVMFPACLYDAATRRFFVTTLTTNLHPASGELTKMQRLDIAVSKTADPSGRWTVYHTVVVNNGTHGLPSHPGCPCHSDTLRMAADASGIYLTTNEQPWPDSGNTLGSNLYAISKKALVAATWDVTVWGYSPASRDMPTYCLTPRALPAGPAPGGAVTFVSTIAIFTNEGASNQVVVLRLDNTKSLDGPSSKQALRLTGRVTSVGQQYRLGQVWAYEQKPGPNPFGQSLGNYSVAPLYPSLTTTAALAMSLADGTLYGACSTDLPSKAPNGNATVGAFIFRLSADGATGRTVGVVSVPGNHVAYPTLALDPHGNGVVAFTLVGPDYWPTAAFATLRNGKLGPVRIGALGRAPFDGYSGYDSPDKLARMTYVNAAAVDERGDIFTSTSYVAFPACDEDFEVPPGTSPARCNGTRAAASNWNTRVAKFRITDN